MKIIALEEHTVDSAIGAATAEVCKNNVPYLDTFYRADMPATPTADSLFKMGEYRLDGWPHITDCQPSTMSERPHFQ